MPAHNFVEWMHLVVERAMLIFDERAFSTTCVYLLLLLVRVLPVVLQDLSAQLCKQLDATREPAGWRTAWVVPIKARSTSTNNTAAPRMASPGL